MGALKEVTKPTHAVTVCNIVVAYICYHYVAHSDCMGWFF
jgi:hypothetical protein